MEHKSQYVISNLFLSVPDELFESPITILAKSETKHFNFLQKNLVAISGHKHLFNSASNLQNLRPMKYL